MTREEVWKSVAGSLRDRFGRLLDVRDVRRLRRVSGDAWAVTVVLAAPSGDLHVADLTVDEAGVVSPELNADHVIIAARTAQRASLAAPPPDELADFGDMGGGSDEGLELFDMLTEEPVEKRVTAAIERGDPNSLHEARSLLPRLLTDHERRGATLFQMAEVERKLGENAIARGYLEASSREFADRFDLPALEKAAALALEILGKDAFAGSPVHGLLEQSRARLQPLPTLAAARSFQGLTPEQLGALSGHATLRTLAPGEVLVNEGAPSEHVFVVKSGLVGVWLEKPSGGSWMVRCCFPGWLLGESSVLTTGARCTATLRAERVSEVYALPAQAVRAVMRDDRSFGQRISETKQIHRIDSFFSMHETMGQLDVQVRDEVLSCIQKLETFDSETILLPANEIPDVACLVARGSVALYEDGKPDAPARVVEADSFYGVRDAIHRIAAGYSAVARAGSTVAFFEGAKLQKLCERSPEHVVAVLERLG